MHLSSWTPFQVLAGYTFLSLSLSALYLIISTVVFAACRVFYRLVLLVISEALTLSRKTFEIFPHTPLFMYSRIRKFKVSFYRNDPRLELVLDEEQAFEL